MISIALNLIAFLFVAGVVIVGSAVAFTALAVVFNAAGEVRR